MNVAGSPNATGRDYYVAALGRLAEMWLRANVNADDEKVRAYALRLREAARSEAQRIAVDTLKEPALFEAWERVIAKGLT